MSPSPIRLAAAGLCGVMLLAAEAIPADAQPTYGDPTASYQLPNGFGYWKARRDRQELRRYKGDPAAQAILRQKRHNLCRNQPEIC